MKRLMIIALLMLAFPVFAQSWTLQGVPNTRLQSNAIHVSDPDNLLSDNYEALVNAAGCLVRDTVDIFVVALNSIGSDDSKDFVTRLFKHWGVGDRIKDNGVLLLIVNDIHAIEIETGYGAEGLLPDAICGRIIKDVMIPHFREGNASLGIKEGVYAMLLHLGADTNGLNPMPVASYDGVTYPAVAESDDVSFGFGLIGSISFMAFFWCSIRTFFKTLGMRKKKKQKKMMLQPEDGVYRISKSDFKTKMFTKSWTKHDIYRNLGLIVIMIVGLVSAGLAEDADGNSSMGLTIVLFFSVLCWWQNSQAMAKAKAQAKSAFIPSECYRASMMSGASIATMICAPWLGWYFYKKYKDIMKTADDHCNCPVCKSAMHLVDDQKLTAVQQKEMELKSMSYKRYICGSGHEFLISEDGKKHESYTVCPVCGGRTRALKNTRVITHATTFSTGLEERTYCCEYCGETSTAQYTIPKKESTSSSSSYGGGSSYSSGGSSHSSGGSFGGGRSGGGGASGRW